MAKAKIEWADLVKTDEPAFLWTSLCIIYLVANIFVQGWGHTAFAYTMVYTLAFLLIAITIMKATSTKKGKGIGALFAVMTVFVSMLTWLTSGTYAIDATSGMWLAIVFTVIALLNEYGVLETKVSVNNKYCLLAALGGIFLFGLLYMLTWLGVFPIGSGASGGWWWYHGSLPPWYTILNHVGITLFALVDMLLILGMGDWEKWKKYRWLFWSLTVLGAAGMIVTDWGLAILHV